jgi:hypothetical protein
MMAKIWPGWTSKLTWVSTLSPPKAKVRLSTAKMDISSGLLEQSL